MSDASNNVDKARKSDEPWSDEERTAFINHVLARADMSSILNELPEALGKEGFPIRARSAVSNLSPRTMRSLQPLSCAYHSLLKYPNLNSHSS